MLPDPKTRCHRTAFKRTCLECVTKHGCRLWKRVTLEGDPNTSPGHAIASVDHYDCVDSLQDLYLKDMLRRQVQTTATVDKLSKEVRENNAGAMGALLGGVNQQLRIMQNETQQALAHAHGDAPKLIGSGNGGARADADA